MNEEQKGYKDDTDREQYSTSELEKANRTIKDMFKSNNQDSLLELARTLKLKKEAQKTMKECLADITGEVTALEAQLYDYMIENNTQGIKIDGKSLYPTLKRWVSIPAAIEEDGFFQLEQLGLKDLIKRKVNTQTLSAEMKTRIEEGEIVKEEDCWKWVSGPLRDLKVQMSISETKKIGIRKA